MSPPAVEVADILRAQGNRFLDRYEKSFDFQQLKAFRAIQRCRTAALGGHIDACPKCGHRAISYNSCLMGSFLFWRVRWRTGVQPVSTRLFDSPLRFGSEQRHQLVRWAESALAEVRRNHGLDGIQLLAGISPNIDLRGRQIAVAQPQ